MGILVLNSLHHHGVTDSNTLVLIGGTRLISSGIGARIYNGSLSLLSSIATSVSVIEVFIDSENNRYIREDVANTLRKYDDTNTLVTNFTVLGFSVFRLTLDSDNNIYVAGQLTSSTDRRARKYDSSFNLIWETDNIPSLSSGVSDISVDNIGNVYITSFNSSGNQLRKYNSSGVFQWERSHGDIVSRVCVDNNNNVYIVGGGSSNVLLRKYDTNGNNILNINKVGYTFSSVYVDRNNDIYVGGSVGPPAVNYGRIIKYNSGGSQIFEVNVEDIVRDIVVNLNYEIFAITGRSVGSNTIFKYNSSGTLLTSVDHGALVNRIAINNKG
jgi:hypothetical protein